MSKFKYKGTTKDGESVERTVEASDRFAVYEIARENGHVVSSIENPSNFNIFNLVDVRKFNELLSRVSSDDLVIATRNLSSMLAAGLPLSRCLSVLERQSKNPKLSRIAHRLQEEINKGNPFHEALSGHPDVFSELYVSMVRAGEESGTLAEALRTLSTQLEHASNLQKKIKGAMIYPTIVLLIMVSIAVTMMIFVMPTITETFRNLEVELPITTRILIATSDFMSDHAILTLSGIIGAFASFLMFLKTMIGKRIFHFLAIRLPVLGNLVRETNAARTARTLSSLLASGVDMINALNITEDVVQNIYYKKVIAEAAVKVEKGDPLSTPFIEHGDIYPILVGEMILVGEETGQISEMLIEVANFFESEVELKTKDLSTIIEPLLMVVIGAAVGFFALAMIAPIYSISDSIG